MGTQKGETLALQWKDVDFKNDIVSISKTVTNKIKGFAHTITTPKTRNSISNIPMFKIVKDSLLDGKKGHKKMYGGKIKKDV